MRNLLERLEMLFELSDTDDQGLGGKEFEKIFVKALKLAGMKFRANVSSGPGWDIHPIGDKWLKLISDKDVNIKVYGTKWMVSSSELYKVIPWDDLPDGYSRDKSEAKVKKIMNAKGLAQIYFLKPRNKDVQEKIVKATNDSDIEGIKELLVNKNFKYEKLGKNYGVRVLDDGKRVTSISIIKDGKVFMRSERPRKTGRSTIVAFRAPTPNISKKKRSVARFEE